MKYAEVIRCALTFTLVHTCTSLTTLSKLPPHAGYHGAGADPNKPFFEGWYLRLITKTQGSIALIFHVFDPHTRRQSLRRGVGMQIISPVGTAFTESSDLTTFRASSRDLEIRNFFPSSRDYFRLTENQASGRATSAQGEVMSAEFCFDILPEIGWGGGDDARQYSTAGWLAAFPVFEPHYQVLISKGKAVGSLSTTNRDGIETLFNLTDATVYLEKNWGGSFPSQWWWIQCNTFRNGLCLTSTGGRRNLPFLNQEEEEVALVALHWNGKFLPFPTVSWSVRWGEWKVEGEYGDYSVKLEGTCDDTGIPVKCPTLSGMDEIARETFHGEIRVMLYEKGALILDETSCEACLEVGGLPWSSMIWKGEPAMKEPLKSLVMNVELERRASDILQLARVFVDIPGL